MALGQSNLPWPEHGATNRRCRLQVCGDCERERKMHVLNLVLVLIAFTPLRHGSPGQLNYLYNYTISVELFLHLFHTLGAIVAWLTW